ncbi:MAG: 50S ribosomal protein L15 [Acidobacteria bacterium]|nr:50S ribosomal protein L15 [Acidobacteriota bacterium]MCG2815982.1 50S ribosomal protein L15 [Candidatus Aminicenantes bacterium]MBU1337594.1 50S ribosomal protein L15 [Acidobacteriota bacterium]MBU1474032.1 50S ribosomal protein L15 [Acidobacteriota bacterium]MBU4203331.1 50S ribosomal protein L15 [Acidobacteriota bacterium]
MNLSNLHPNKSARKNRKRLGRGPGSGWGKTAGRGSKGQKSIAGYSRKIGFEGGQMPLNRRLPKRGFTNIFKKVYTTVNLHHLEKIKKNNVTLKEMVVAGLIKKEKEEVKILGRGDLSSAKTIHAHKFSASAKEKIEKAGGKAVLIGS